MLKSAAPARMIQSMRLASRCCAKVCNDRIGSPDQPPHRLANQVGRRHRIGGGVRRELDVEENVALEATGKRQIKRTGRILFEKVFPRVGHDPHHFDSLIRCAGPTALLTDRSLIPAFGPRRVVGRKLDFLAERIAIRPELFREHFVDDRDFRLTASASLRWR